MKKNYTSPELTLVEFAESQIILTSSAFAGEEDSLIDLKIG